MTENNEIPEVQEEVLVQEIPEQEDFKDKYLRLLADMENMRKRMSREKTESVKYSLDSIVSDFLIPLDNLDNALKYATNDQASAELKNSSILTSKLDILKFNI